MNRINLNGSKKTTGYDLTQVDRYVHKVTEEYEILQRSYTELEEKYDMLQRRNNETVDAVAKAIVDAEVEAMRIITDAKVEAQKIIKYAYQELKIVQDEKVRLTSELREIVQKVKAMGQTKRPVQQYQPYTGNT